MDITELKRRCREEFCIPVDEDYSFQEWIWFPPVPQEDIEAFWAARGEFDWSPDKCIPGDWVRAEECYGGDVAEFYALYSALWQTPGTYAVHFDGQLSAGLLTPDGRAVFHAAFDEETGMRDYVVNWARKRAEKLAAAR